MGVSIAVCESQTLEPGRPRFESQVSLRTMRPCMSYRTSQSLNRYNNPCLQGCENLKDLIYVRCTVHQAPHPLPCLPPARHPLKLRRQIRKQWLGRAKVGIILARACLTGALTIEGAEREGFRECRTGGAQKKPERLSCEPLGTGRNGEREGSFRRQGEPGLGQAGVWIFPAL